MCFFSQQNDILFRGQQNDHENKKINEKIKHTTMLYNDHSFV